MTGASGGIGTRLRKLLPPIYPDLLLSDIRPPADLAANEQFKAADLSDMAQCEAICEGVAGILHFGGYTVEGPWDDILQANIIGATISSRPHNARASSAACSPRRTTRAASIRVTRGSA